MKIKLTRKKIIAGACVIAAAVLVIVLLIVFGACGNGGESGSNQDVQYEDYTVGTSEMVRTLTAAGEITAAESEDIEFSTYKTFRAMCVEENEIVTAGQNLILYSDGTYETAPEDGLIKSINAPDTGSVGTSENLISFGKTDTLSLEVTVPEDQISEISKGDKAAIVTGADQSREYKGKITGKREMSTTLISEKESEVAAETSEDSTESESGEMSSGSGMSDMNAGGSDPFGSESSTAYYTVVVEFTNDGTLKPGMSASCTVTVSDRDDVLTVPVEAVYYDSKDRPYVNMIKGTGTQKQLVSTGESDADNVEITKGLEKGDKIQVESRKQEET